MASGSGHQKATTDLGKSNFSNIVGTEVMWLLHRIFHSMSGDQQTGKDGFGSPGDGIYSGQFPHSAVNLQGSYLGLCRPLQLHPGNRELNHSDCSVYHFSQE